MEFTDYDVWAFHKDDAGRWHWCRRSPEGSVIIEARAPLSTFEECQEDARRFGYVSGCQAGK